MPLELAGVIIKLVGGRFSSSPSRQLCLPCGRSLPRLDSRPVRCCCYCCVLDSSPKKLPWAPSWKLALLRSYLCREGSQFQSRGTSYVHHEPRIVSIFDQKPSLSSTVNQLTLVGGGSSTFLLPPLSRPKKDFHSMNNFTFSVITSSSCCWLETQGWANPACCSGRFMSL